MTAQKNEQLEKARTLVDITTMEEAERVEETILTGYIDAIMENIINWIGIEEDLTDSYEKFSKNLPSPEQRRLANELHMLSSSDADILRKKLGEFEGLQNEYKKRIQRVKKLTKKE